MHSFSKKKKTNLLAKTKMYTCVQVCAVAKIAIFFALVAIFRNSLGHVNNHLSPEPVVYLTKFAKIAKKSCLTIYLLKHLHLVILAKTAIFSIFLNFWRNRRI